MTKVVLAGLFVTLVLTGSPAAAQTAAGSSAAPTGRGWYLGANTGIAGSARIGAVAGLEGGVHLWKRLDAVGELVWLQNAVTSRQRDRVRTLAGYLALTQGMTASGDIRAPARYAGLGGRWVFEPIGRWQPYVLVTVGGAHVHLNPSFRLGGSNVTGQMARYGVTLGQDVIGTSNHAAVSAGGGVVVTGFGPWYLDGGIRVLSIGGPTQRTNVGRLVLGGGYRF